MICSASPLMAGKMDEVAQTVQRFIDYNGTTAAGLHATMSTGFEAALEAGFRAASERARKMSAGF